MLSQRRTHFLIVAAGAAGLMAARELARSGKKVTIPEARDRCGGRIYPLSAQEFGYPAEGGAEFVHGAAPATPLGLKSGQRPMYNRPLKILLAAPGITGQYEPIGSDPAKPLLQ